MKKILVLVILMFAINKANAQTVENAVSNHVFVIGDSYGSPVYTAGQAMFISIYSNGKVILMMGSDLNNAISNMKSVPSSSKTGIWLTSEKESKLWFVWTDGKKSIDWIFDAYTGKLKAGSSTLKDLGKF